MANSQIHAGKDCFCPLERTRNNKFTVRPYKVKAPCVESGNDTPLDDSDFNLDDDECLASKSVEFYSDSTNINLDRDKAELVEFRKIMDQKMRIYKMQKHKLTLLG